MRLPIDRVRTYHHSVLFVVVLANFCLMGIRLVLGPLVPDITQAFDVSKTAVGIALTGMWAAYALFQFPSGVLSDYVGEPRVILAALAVTGVASILLALSPTFPLFGLFVVGLGAGTGLFFTSATIFLTRLFTHEGQAIGVLTAGGALAGLLVPGMAAWITVRYSWRLAILFGVTAFPIAAIFLRRVHTATPGSSETASHDLSLATVVEILFRPPILFSIAIGAVAVFTFQSITSFFPTFLIEYWAFSAELAGLTFGIVFFLSASFQPISGRLSDRFSRDLILLMNLVVTVFGFSLLLLGTSRVAIVVGVLLVGIGTSWAAIVQVRFMDALDDSETGLGFGLARSSFMLLGAVSSAVVGSLADHAGWVTAYGAVVGLLLAITVLIVVNLVFDLEM